jgi:hypothetical protein
LLFGLIVTPLVSFLGGTGPVAAFTLGRPAHVALQLVYRALVVPPGMAYAVPLLLWWGLLVTLEGKSLESFVRAEVSANGAPPKVVS